MPQLRRFVRLYHQEAVISVFTGEPYKLNEGEKSMRTRVKILRIAAIIFSLAWFIGFIGGMIAKSQWLIFIGIVSYFVCPILAYLLGSLLEGGARTGCALALMALFLPIVVLPILVYKVKPENFVDRKPIVDRGPVIRLSTQWKCPACGTVLLKSDPLIEQQIRNGALVSGTVTCAHCQAQYSAREIYTGKYDD